MPNPDGASIEALQAKVGEFADELTETVESVLPGVNGQFTALANTRSAAERVTLRQEERSGFALKVDGVPLLRLVVNFRLSWNGSKQYLSVEKSEFKVFAEGSSVPLVRFDYLRDPAPTIPCAHINVHAHRDEVVYAMMRSADIDRGKERSRSIAEQRIPSFRELHLPLGGHRFRPCLEDVLQMLLVEFGLDRQEGYQQAIDRGRERYRIQQVRAAASDDLEEVANLLRDRGYEVIPPSITTSPRHDRLTAY